MKHKPPKVSIIGAGMVGGTTRMIEAILRDQNTVVTASI